MNPDGPCLRWLKTDRRGQVATLHSRLVRAASAGRKHANTVALSAGRSIKGFCPFPENE